MAPSTTVRAGVGAAIVLLVVMTSVGAARGPDALTEARRLYNQGQFDQALEAARPAANNPSTMSSARLVMGRSRLERYRLAPGAPELDAARGDFHAVDPRALNASERIELQVGLGELLYFDDRFGAAAEILDPVVDLSATLGPEAHERALDWWATALDRQAQAQPPAERPPAYVRITARMEQELRRDPASAPASYWLTASARAAGDLDRAWASAWAGWIRSTLGRDRGVALRADLDTLVTQAIIPDRAARVATRDRRQAAASMAAEWESFKKIW